MGSQLWRNRRGAEEAVGRRGAGRDTPGRHQAGRHHAPTPHGTRARSRIIHRTGDAMSDPDAARARLSELAAAAADGRDVDWAAARARTTDPERDRLLRELEIVAAISKALRGHGDGAAEAAPEAQQDEVSTATARPHPDAAADSLTAWGRLRIIELIGHGSFGRVFRAWEPQLQREVALKVLDLVQPGTEDTAVAEARLLAQIR